MSLRARRLQFGSGARANDRPGAMRLAARALSDDEIAALAADLAGL